MKRTRQLPTVVLPRSRRSAIELLTSPSALPRMMRARALNDAGNDRLRANELSFVRSSSDTTKSAFGLPLVSAVSPLKRYRSGLPYSCPLIAGQDTSSWRAASSPASIRGGSQAGGHRRAQRLDGQRPNGSAIDNGTHSRRRDLKRAARMLLSLMRGDSPASDCVGVGYELMIRGSSLTSKHRIASHRLASPRIASPRLAAPRLAAPRRAAPRVTSCAQGVALASSSAAPNHQLVADVDTVGLWRLAAHQ